MKSKQVLRGIEEHLGRQVEVHGLTLTEFAVLEVLKRLGRFAKKDGDAFAKEDDASPSTS